MSEETRDDFFDDFDVDEALRLINKKLGKDVPCPYCGGTVWMEELRSETEDSTIKIVRSPAFVPKDARSFWGPTPSIPVVSLTCQSCGNLRLHNYAWVMNMLRRKAEEPTDE